MSKIPDSKRYCPVCECIRTFQFSKTIGHCRCQICLYHGQGVSGNRNGKQQDKTRSIKKQIKRNEKNEL